MHTYREVAGKFQVGYYINSINWNATAGNGSPSPSYPVTSEWKKLSEHDHEVQAAERVNHLNGGHCKFV
jgi:hypothetical protein